jgi:hypothetical protein
MTESVVLIISTDTIAAALLGAAIELSGYVPYFPREQESARDALRRTRPGIVFVDCDHEEAASDAFLGPAMMTGACLAIFGSPRAQRDYRRIANAYELRCFGLPVDHEELLAVLMSCSRELET